MKLTPIVIYPGNKHNKRELIFSQFPKEFDTYYEPFLGGGAIALHVYQNTQAKLFLSDVNENLMFFYEFLKNQPRELIKQLAEFRKLLKLHRRDKKLYYCFRELYSSDVPVQRAAGYYFLLKTTAVYQRTIRNMSRERCGAKYSSRKFTYNKHRLLEFSEFLNDPRVELKQADFRDIIVSKTGSVMYLDPPFHPFKSCKKSKLVGFIKKNNKAWRNRCDRDLKDKCDEWDRAGAKFVLQNRWSIFINDLFWGYRFTEIPCGSKNPQNFQKEIFISNFSAQ